MDTYLNSTAQFEPTETARSFKYAASSIASEGSMKVTNNKKADDSISANFLEEMIDTEATNDGYLNDTLNSIGSSSSSGSSKASKASTVLPARTLAPRQHQPTIPEASEAMYDVLAETRSASIKKASSSEASLARSADQSIKNSSKKQHSNNASKNSAEGIEPVKPEVVNPKKVVKIVNQPSRMDRTQQSEYEFAEEQDEDNYGYEHGKIEQRTSNQKAYAENPYSTFSQNDHRASKSSAKKPEKKQNLIGKFMNRFKSKKSSTQKYAKRDRDEEEESDSEWDDDEDEMNDEGARRQKSNRKPSRIEEEDDDEDAPVEPIYEALDDIGPRDSGSSREGSVVSKIVYPNAVLKQKPIIKASNVAEDHYEPFSANISDKRMSFIPKPLEIAANNYNQTRKSVYTGPVPTTPVRRGEIRSPRSSL